MFLIIQVKPSDSTLLEIKQQAKTHGSLQYKVKVLNEISSDSQMFIYVHSPLTLQDIEVSRFCVLVLVSKMNIRKINIFS